MAKIDITKTELVWPGKYNEDGTLNEAPRVSLPFQVIETVNESRATREVRKPKTMTLFDIYEPQEGDTFEEGWRNKLIWGDNLVVMNSLLETFAGKIKLIYIDPPFATGLDFSFEAPVGEKNQKVAKEQSIIEEKAYRDTWGLGVQSYIEMLYRRLQLMRELLTPDGSIYVHCDWHVNAYIRLMLDELFGQSNFRNSIVWHYYNKYSAASHCLPRAHDDIFFYSRSENVSLNEIREKRDKPVRQLVRENVGGVLKNARDADGNLLYRMSYDKKIDDVWRIPQLQPASKEWTGYSTQKHHDLLDRIIRSSSKRGDLVADFFCGSGTTIAVAEKLGRRWIGCDLGRWGVHVTRKRLLDIEDCRPFELLNLGKYERQYWQRLTFGTRGGSTSERTLYEYLIFILKLYGAEPIAGTAYVHGKKGAAMVHIGAVDAPVTIDEINNAIDECVKLRQDVLHVLGWEWEMGLAGPNANVGRGGLMHDLARQKGVKLLLFQIPREVMEQHEADISSVRFFELAHLRATMEHSEGLTVQARLEDFVIPNTELIPDDVRKKIDKWSDYIDYWAVDWDFQNDTFMQGWVTYRTRRDRTLSLTSDSHTYPQTGRYRVLIKVIDIFGNDTSQAFDIEVG